MACTPRNARYHVLDIEEGTLVYIKSKSSNSDRYLYLVKSVWDPKKRTSRQEIIKYLGKASKVVPSDIPSDHRNDPRIIAFLASNTGNKMARNQKMVRKMQESIFKALTAGDLDKALLIYESYSKTADMAEFYDNILRPAMYKIGSLWAQNRLDISDEHVASNVASELVSIINKRSPGPVKRAKVLVCTPSGEEHSLGCNILQSLLQSKGYTVFNMSPSAPAEAVIHRITETDPDIVLVSISTKDSIKTCQRLIKKIQKASIIPIMVGGQALSCPGAVFDCDTIHEQPLENIPKIISKKIKTAS